MASFPIMDGCGWTLADKVHEVIRMLLNHLKADDRMIAFGSSESLDVAREIIGLKLQGPNSEGKRCWKLNPDKLGQRLRAAGLDSETYELIQPDLFDIAIERALDTLAERKAKNQRYKADNRKVLREARKAQTLPVETEQIPFDEAGRYNGQPIKKEVPRVLPQGSVGAAIKGNGGQDEDFSFGGNGAGHSADSWGGYLLSLNALDQQQLACKKGQRISQIRVDDRPDSQSFRNPRY